MSVKIRLSRVGRVHLPMYRVVAVDSRKKRDGAVLANIGTYDALTGKVIQFHDDLYNEWVQKGAQPSDTVKKVHRMFKKDGIAKQVKPAADPASPAKKAAPKKKASESAPKKQAESDQTQKAVESEVEASVTKD